MSENLRVIGWCVDLTIHEPIRNALVFTPVCGSRFACIIHYFAIIVNFAYYVASHKHTEHIRLKCT